MKKEIKEEIDWEKDIFKGCISAERLYQLHSDQTPESWFAIYEANVIQKIRLLLSQRDKMWQERIKIIEGLTPLADSIRKIGKDMGFLVGKIKNKKKGETTHHINYFYFPPITIQVPSKGAHLILTSFQSMGATKKNIKYLRDYIRAVRYILKEKIKELKG